MEQKKIDRINELAKKAKIEPLSQNEKSEQQILRKEYLESYRRNMKAALENLVIERPDGTQVPIKKREKTNTNQ